MENNNTSKINLTKRFASPSSFNKQEISMLQEPHLIRKKGEKVEQALYRDHLQRAARHKLITETNAQVQKQQQNTVKLTIKTQQLAIQKLDKDLDALVKYFSHQSANDKTERSVCRDEIIQLFRMIECFKELDTQDPHNISKDNSMMVGKNSFISNRDLNRSISPNIKKDAFRQSQRLKSEQEFLGNLWNFILSPNNPVEAQFDMVIEAFKILFNHYLPVPKQVDLLVDLQKIVNFGNNRKILDEEQIEEKIVKKFQQLYNHYYNLNNISKVSNQEKVINNFKDHYKDFTFKPKINPESTNMDYHNISQVYAKLQKEQKNRDRSSILRQSMQKSGQPDVEVAEPTMTDSDDDASQNLNENNLHKFNNMLSKYLQEYKTSEIVNKAVGNRQSSHNKNISQQSALTNNESVKTVLVHKHSNDLARSKTPKINEKGPKPQKPPIPHKQNSNISVNSNSQITESNKSPDKVFRFEYWYLQEKLKQDKLKKQIEDKMKKDVQGCTFKPQINKSVNTSYSRSPVNSQKESKLNQEVIKNYYATPTTQSHRKFEDLYKNEKVKKQMRDDIAKKKKEEREQKQLSECTFKPRLVSKSPLQEANKREHNKSPAPTGYEDTINRMRMANQEKIRQKELMDNLGKPKRENIERSVTPTKQTPFNLSYQQKLDRNAGRKQDKPEQDVLLYMEILVKQGQKVKLKVKRDDSPRSVASNFSKIYGLNQKSEDALSQIIIEQIKKEKLQVSSIKTTSERSNNVPTTIREGLSLVEDDSFDSKSYQQLNNLSGIKHQQSNFDQSLGMIDEKQENGYDDDDNFDEIKEEQAEQESSKHYEPVEVRNDITNQSLLHQNNHQDQYEDDEDDAKDEISDDSDDTQNASKQLITI